MSQDEALPRSAAGPYSPWLIAMVVSIATFMEVLDVTIANVALRHIAGSLGASQDESTWIITSYLISNAIVLPISGWLSNVIGRKRFYMACVAIFTVSSVLCAFANSLTYIVVMRVIQGAGGGGLAPTEQSIFADTFPPRLRAQAFALYGLTVVVAPAVGPVLGGVLTDSYSWHWVFLINLPVGLLSLALVASFVHEPPALIEDRRKLLKSGFRIDYLGFFLVAAGFGTLQVVLDRFERDDGFSSPFITLMSVVCVVSLVVLVVWEWFQATPAVDVRLLRIPSFAISNAIMFLIGFMLISTTQLLPQLTQSIMGYDATSAGMTLGMGGLATIFLMPVAGVVTGRLVAPRWLIAGALIMTGLALLHMSRLDATASFWSITWARVWQAIPLPFLFIPMAAASYVGLPADKTNEASALINLMRNLGGSVGVSFATTELEWRTQFHHARLAEHITAMTDIHGQPLAQLAATVQTQAAVLSYLDIFWVLGVISLLVWPITLALRGDGEGAVHGH